MPRRIPKAVVACSCKYDGHRVMVQVQSSLLPLYDRNPQKFVPNICLAKKAYYKKATVTIERGGASASAVGLALLTAKK